MTDSQIANIFRYHAPTGTQAARYQDLRSEALHFARMVNDLCPESREKSLAIMAIQQAVQWANAAIAINENEAKPAG